MIEDSIKRYTELPFVLQVLQEKKLTLLNPASWDDKNDAYYVRQYKLRSKLKGVFALCFTEEVQTYHHWRIFTHGASGACIHFHKNKFHNWVQEREELLGKCVQYKTIPELRSNRPELSELPFIKRDAYKHEAEYRILHKSKTKSTGTISFDFPIDLVERIVLNPWLPSSTVKSIGDLIHSIDECENLKIIRATIVNSNEWKMLADESTVFASDL